MRTVAAGLLIGCLALSACEPDVVEDPGFIPEVAPEDDSAEVPIDDPDPDVDPAQTIGDAASIQPAALGSDDPAELAALAAEFNTLGFDLHRALAADGGNVITSPLSIATLLALVTAGADGQTAEELTTLLGLEQTRDPRVGALLLAIADTTEVSVAVANALWANLGIPLDDGYAAYVGDVLGATTEELDLGDAAAAERIDDWVRERTAGRIDGVADALGLPEPTMAVVLVNAVHFVADWSVRFDAAMTRDGPFTLQDGSQVMVPMMQRQPDDDELLGYIRRDGYQLLRLPYGGHARYGLEVFLPDEDADLDTMMAQLDAGEWQAAVAATTRFGPTEIRLPRLELQWDGELSDELQALGIPSAFEPGADFSQLSPVPTLLSVVVHRTSLRVDEEGTEAAAVTAGGMEATSGPPELFIVDRPFLLTISDADTGTVLFIASVTDPR